MAISPGQTLKGNGAFNVLGNLQSEGAIELKLAKGATLTNDKIQGMSHIIYGGVLRLVISGDALSEGDSFDLFDSASYSGEFASFQPATPGPELGWELIGGTLHVVQGGVAEPPSFGTVLISNGEIVLNASGGIPGAAVHLLASSDVAAPLPEWTVVETAQFDSNGDLTITRAVAP